MNQERVAEFTQLMRDCVDSDPITITKDGLVLDGVHRLLATMDAGIPEV